MNEYLEVKSSPIHGNGLFSLISIPAKTKIVDYFGEEMELGEFKKKYGSYSTNSLFTYRMKRINKILVAKQEPFLSQNIINNINESKEPNCILMKRALYSLRDISPDEELTLLYPSDYCRCYQLK
jgi:SET domain-containing protein